MKKFTVEEIIALIQYSGWNMEYFMPLQNEVTDRVNAKLRGENVDSEMTPHDITIYERCAEKIAADALELDNIAKYSGIDPHPAQKIEIGAIIVSSWGYDQTNVDFYVVVEMTAKMVKLLPMDKELCRNQTPGYSSMAGEVRATKGIKFRSEVMKRKLSDWIKVTECSYARLWNGKKQYESWYA
jgi:hypothetical protein